MDRRSLISWYDIATIDTPMEAVIFIGLQASGKSTFYQERFFNTHVRINLDMLKTRNREKQSLQVCLQTLALSMKEAYGEFVRQIVNKEL